MAVPDAEFEQYLLAEDLIQQYRRRTTERIRQLKREFWREREFHRQQKRDGIELEKKHRTLLNLAVFPFTGGQPGATIGYQFVRGSPLAELNLPNFDCLIAKLEGDHPVIVFVEAKGTVEDAFAVVRQTLRRREVALANLDLVRTRYLKLPPGAPVGAEFCIVCPSIEATEVVRAAGAGNPKLIVWHASLSGEPLLKLASPPEIPDRHQMLHSDRSLNDLLSGVTSSFSCFDLWPQLHPTLELGSTLRLLERGDRDQFVTKELVRTVVASDMFYLTTEEQDAKTDNLVELAVRVGFLEPAGDDGKHRVASANEKRTAIEARAHNKWIEYALKEDLARMVDDGLLLIQEEFRKLRAGRPTLEDVW